MPDTISTSSGHGPAVPPKEMTLGDIGTTVADFAAAARNAIEAGADLIALGRPFLADPDLVRRLRTGAPLNPVRDRYLMYAGGETGYTDYPTLAAS